MRLIIVIAALLVAQTASAQEWNPYRTMRESCEWTGTCWKYRYDRWSGEWQRVRRVYRPRVYSYVRREEDERHGHCRDMRRITGDQHLTLEGAKKAANDAWAGNVRFHYGEKFMDLSNAERIGYTCSRSSIKEGGVTTLGQTLTRCELAARPCAARKTEGERE